MPPTPGIFPIPYNTVHNASQMNYQQHGMQMSPPSNGVVASSHHYSNGSGNSHIIGPGVPGSGSGQGSSSSKLSRHGHGFGHSGVGGVPDGMGYEPMNNGGGGGGGISIMSNGHSLGQPQDMVYGPGIGHGLHPASALSGHQHNLQPFPPNQHGVIGHGRLATTSGVMEESIGRREKRKKESTKHKEPSDRRDDNRHFNESISTLHNNAHLLSTRPELSAYFHLRLYPLSLERSALLSQFASEERWSNELAEIAYQEEKERVEEEWRKGRERVRERLLEGIEERRRRAREEKEGEGVIGDVGLDSHARQPVTRKLRNKLGPGGTSPPTTPQLGLNGLPALSSSNALASSSSTSHHLGTMTTISNLPITSGPFLNPHSLNVDDLPSAFPLPLTATGSGGYHYYLDAVGSGSNTSGGANGASSLGNGGAGASGAVASAAGGAGNRSRRPKGGAGGAGQVLGGLGKSLLALNAPKESMEIENDLNEIKRGNKRRRAAAMSGVAGR
ncbi:hypothetical protein CPB83DRAFT_862952 [Crepidotus variabilis]|uniref:Uncharacterized protein n=1 Tax=Crepidotus variabilis TaxID=179855 RepID=A0A9P6E676_9AGAR|nr:hypothetical protein CPB83DRAFT_862952 [Crepidotus variabilis]